jgi:hypothetical protein
MVDCAFNALLSMLSNLLDLLLLPRQFTYILQLFKHNNLGCQHFREEQGRYLFRGILLISIL